MQDEIAFKWIRALRSGEYTQGKNHLHAGNAHCCLGVLCEVIGFQASATTMRTEENDMVFGYGKECQSGGLPEEVQNIAGLDQLGGPRSGDRIHIGEGDYESLAEANDGNCTFAEIANWIEENYDEL